MTCQHWWLVQPEQEGSPSVKTFAIAFIVGLTIWYGIIRLVLDVYGVWS